MSQHGRVVARASALFLRRGPQPEGQVWSGAVAAIPPVPVDAGPLESEAPFGIWTYSANSDAGSPGMPPLEWEQPDVQKFAWTRIFRPMVAGHPLTPFARAAFAGDIISSLTHWGTAGLRYINADYTVAISRLPEGEYIGLAAQTYYGNDGVGTGSATLFDSTGPIGTGTALALAQPAGAFPARSSLNAYFTTDKNISPSLPIAARGRYQNRVRWLPAPAAHPATGRSRSAHRSLSCLARSTSASRAHSKSTSECPAVRRCRRCR